MAPAALPEVSRKAVPVHEGVLAGTPKAAEIHGTGSNYAGTAGVVDWCECYWGTDDERIVDLSHAA